MAGRASVSCWEPGISSRPGSRPCPVQPNDSTREWTLADNHYDGRVLLYALVSWDAADPTDYLAAG